MIMELANLLCRMVIAISAVFIACYFNHIMTTLGLINDNLRYINNNIQSTQRDRLAGIETQLNQINLQLDQLESISWQSDRIANAVENEAEKGGD